MDKFFFFIHMELDFASPFVNFLVIIDIDIFAFNT